MEETNSINIISRYSRLNLKETLFQIKKNWYWFILSLIFFMLLSIVYNKYAKKRFQVHATILVQKESTLEAFTPLTRNVGWNTTINKKNEVGVLSSYELQLKTLQDLKWNISWFKKNLFNQIELYKNDPYEIIQNGLQIKNVPVLVKSISSNGYEISCDGSIENNGIKQKIKFDKRLSYGERFKNKYFDIIIKKSATYPIEIGREYFFIFNDLNKLAANYQENLQIKINDDESDLIDIDFSTTDSSRGVDYLNRLLAIYIQTELEEKNRIVNNAISFIDAQISGITDSLQGAEKSFTNFKAQNKIVNLDQEALMVLQKLQDVEKQESDIRNKLEYYFNLKKYLNNEKGFKNLALPSIVGITDPFLNTQVVQLSDLYSRREVLSYSVQESNPNLISLNNEINYTQIKLAENINNLINNSQIELNNVTNQKQVVNNQLERLPKTEQSFVNIKRTRDINNELYTFLLQRRAEAGIALASNNPDSRIIDRARTETVTFLGASFALTLFIGFLISLLIPIIALILKKILDNRLRTVEEIKSRLGFAVAGEISKNNLEGYIPVQNYPNSKVAESFRELRINLEYLLKAKMPAVIAVQSAITGEGRSFVSVNLATSLALSKRNVLLIETDIIKPIFLKIFKLENKAGFWDYFVNSEIKVSQLSVTTKIPGLSVIFPGSASLYLSDLLNVTSFEKFLDEAKKDYDFVVIDNAPMQIVSYPKIIAQQVDVNLFLLRLNLSGIDQFNYINQLLQERIIKNFAVCVNDVNMPSKMKNHKGYGDYLNERLDNIKTAL